MVTPTLTWYLSLARARISPVFHTARVLALTRQPSTRGPLSTWQQTSLHGAQVGQERDAEELSSLKICMRSVCCITARGSHRALSPALTQSTL